MQPTLIIVAAWLCFGGSHLLLSSSNLRDRMGAKTFTALFAAVAFVSLSLLIYCVIVYGGQGMAGPGLGRNGLLLWVFTGLSLIGAVLIVAGLLNYPKSPMAKLAERARRAGEGGELHPPTQVERVTRHPFFVGLILLMTVHAFMAQTLAQAAYFAGFALTALLGIYMQDRKLRKRWQEVYAEYEAQTAALPGGAVAVEPPPTAGQWVLWLAAVGIVVIGIVGLHSFWSAGHGAVFAGFILAFGTLATVAALLRN